MHKILQNHLLCAFVANLKIGAIYALYPESFCNKNLAIRKVFAFCDSGCLLVDQISLLHIDTLVTGRATATDTEDIYKINLKQLLIGQIPSPKKHGLGQFYEAKSQRPFIILPLMY